MYVTNVRHDGRRRARVDESLDHFGFVTQLYFRYASHMGRKRFADMNCSVAQSLDVLGDWWTLLIVREALFGTHTFSGFERNLGISKNILALRLENLVEQGIMRRVDVGRYGTRHHYRLTEKGADLITVIESLRQWSDRWVYGEGREPVHVVDIRTGEPLPPLIIRDAAGKPMSPGNVAIEPGPGAEPATRRRFRKREETSRN
jgi:DNA-binding HxlR family transcriptional regulator